MEVFAFWKYDLFPFIHGGEVTELFDKGIVEVKNCKGYRFKSFRLTNLKEGMELKQKLKQLEQEHRTEILAVNNKYINKVKELGFTELEVSYLKET